MDHLPKLLVVLTILKKYLTTVLAILILYPFYAQPNILVLMADDAGLDFGCYGNDKVTTPNVDRLAKEGLKFNNAFLTTPQCSPSRTSLLAGQFAHSIGTEVLHADLNSSTSIIPHYLKQVGYFSGIMLKTHIGKYGVDQFDFYDHSYVDHFNGSWDTSYLNHFKDFLDSTGDQPFFLWVGFMDPHRPYENKITSAPKLHDPDDVKVPPYLNDQEETRIDLARYYDHLYRMDSKIGGILEELETRNLDENTVVIFLSDNGMPFPRAKATLYDSGIQSPLIIKWPHQIDQNILYDSLVSLIDLAPTILDIAGAEMPRQMFGNSFQNAFYDQTINGDQYVFAERNRHDSEGISRCVRSARFKLILNYHVSEKYPISGQYKNLWDEFIKGENLDQLTAAQKSLFKESWPKVEYYDLVSDPMEINNLAENRDFKIPVDMLTALLEWQVITNDNPFDIKGQKVSRGNSSQWMKWVRSANNK